MHTPLALNRLSALVAYEHGLYAYCPACRRDVELDLRHVLLKYGDRPLIGLRIRCRACGGRGQVQLRAPVRGFGGAPGQGYVNVHGA